jgi:lipoprotein-anchoring transpeptidase ErfK/SrfK
MTSYPSPTVTSTQSVSTAPSLTPPVGVKWIDLDLSEQRLTAHQGDTAIFSALVSTGLPRTPTPIGEFKIYRKVRSQVMSGPGYYLPNVQWVSYFYKGNAIHGTYWHNNFGQPMSHGCVNLRNADAEWIYNWAPLGTRVSVHR